MKPQNQNNQNIVPMLKNVPEKYKNCPPDLMWAIDLDMNQDSKEFQDWISPVKKIANENTQAWVRENKKSKFKIVK